MQSKIKQAHSPLSNAGTGQKPNSIILQTKVYKTVKYGPESYDTACEPGDPACSSIRVISDRHIRSFGAKAVCAFRRQVPVLDLAFGCGK